MCYVGALTRQPAIGVVAALADGMGGAKGDGPQPSWPCATLWMAVLGSPITLGVAANQCARGGCRESMAALPWADPTRN